MNNKEVDYNSKKMEKKYTPSLCGIGFIGEGKYKSVVKGKRTAVYATWKRMLERCYSEVTQKNFPAYIGCSVCNEWHDLQYFGKWFDENYYNIEDERMELDKDILIKGNKTYSQETCVFVPHHINVLFQRNASRRGDLPIGIRRYQKTNRCDVYLRIGSRCSSKYLGSWSIDNVIDAFNAYKTAKEQYIKQVADEYKSKYPQFPQKLYDAMYRYEVEITD